MRQVLVEVHGVTLPATPDFFRFMYHRAMSFSTKNQISNTGVATQLIVHWNMHS